MNNFDIKVTQDDEEFHFTLSGVNVSMANSIRRTILSDIPSYQFDTELDENGNNGCSIEINTGRLHNEILKHRLSCIPIHMEVEYKKDAKKDDLLVGKYVLDVDVKNDGDKIMYVTTGDFRVKNKSTGKYLTENELSKMFPKCDKTNSHIIFARLRPKISDTIPGEHIKLTCEFKIATADMNSACTAVSTCTYKNTIDIDRADRAWEELRAKLESEKVSAEEIEFNARNFEYLDKQRYFVADSFDFVVESVGVYDNRTIVKMAAAVLQGKFIDMVEYLESNSDMVAIMNSESTMENSYDIILRYGDYTLGKVVEYLLYTRFFEGEKTLSFCGFKKFHPHDTEVTIRVSFKQPADKTLIQSMIKQICNDAKAFYTKFYNSF
jgi:DNA-directed RNA polymerase alpha subunit/DNA-directed RNA polymerase subunit L